MNKSFLYSKFDSTNQIENYKNHRNIGCST